MPTSFPKLFIVILIFVPNLFCHRTMLTGPISIRKYDQADILLEEEDRRDILRDIKTIYAPEYRMYTNGSTSSLFNVRKRESPYKQGVADYDYDRHNIRDDESDSLFTETYKFNDNDLKEIINGSFFEKYANKEHVVTECPNIMLLNISLGPYSEPDEADAMTESTFSSTSWAEGTVMTDTVATDTATTKKVEDYPLKNMTSFWYSDLSTREIRTLQGKVMSQYMNPTVDPCSDFYEYACGRWKNYYTIPPDRTTYDTFEIVRENLDFALKGLLDDIKVDHINENPYFLTTSFVDKRFLPHDKGDATMKAKIFYTSCMQMGVIARRGSEPLANILQELGGWPIISKTWIDRDFDVIWLLARLRLLNNDVLIAQWVGPDMKNSNEYIVHIDQTTLGLPSREYYLEQSNMKYVRAYKVFILSVVELMGANFKTAEADADDIIQFEVELAKIMASAEERRNISEIYLRTDLASLTLYFPQFDWKAYFDIVLGTRIDRKTPVAVYCARFLHDLLYLLSNTPGRTLQNYLIWRFVRHRTNNMDQKFMEAKQRFYFILFGREKQPPRWQFCVSQVNSNMGMALGRLFVKKYFDKSSKTDTTQMTKDLEEAFKRTLTENSWLDNNTKDYARMKLDYMDLKIGFPDFILDDTELATRYYDVELHPDYFFENVLVILRHLTKVEQRRMGTMVNRTLWSTPPAVVNAYYSRNKNQIMFPAGMLQPPFYNRHFPKALNFGGIGVVIGHEITHGFDDKGRLFDHEGNLHLWWRESSIEKFYEKSQCMIDQYGQYVLPEIRIALDGYLTQGENIADNGGLKQSYKAYETWLKRNPYADETLPGLNLTSRQLFFLNFAQVWCGQQRIEAAKSRLKTSVHSPGIFRVIGVLSNSQEFSEVFHCPKNSPMNPEFKCIIW